MAEKRHSDDALQQLVPYAKRQQREQDASQPASGAFRWEKKVEKQLREGQQVSQDERAILQQRHAELERIQYQRERYEAKMAEKKEQLSVDERRRLAEEAAKELEKERDFHLKQHLDRASKRITEGRTQPVDTLVQALHLQPSLPIAKPDFRPYHVFESMRVSDLQGLLTVVDEIADVDIMNEQNKEYWNALTSLMRWQIDAEKEAELKDRLAVETGTSAASNQLLDSVSNIVEEALSGGPEELRALKEYVDSELNDPHCTDPDFWGAVKPRLLRREAECLIEQVYLERLREAQRVSVSAPDAAADGATDMPGADYIVEGPPDSDFEAPDWIELSDGRFSPEPEPLSAKEAAKVVDVEEDREALSLLRRKVREEFEARRSQVSGTSLRTQAPAAPDVRNTAAEEALMRRAEASLGGSDFEWSFRGLVPLEAKEYWWKEKHKPRKPKFFNKVHTGYSWNKYNRAHYDVDNPPPKVVQGYKFNIFYPDLIDPSKAPTYKVVEDPSGDDSTCLLVFQAGPPYEDVAFRIVNKKWDRGPKKGFRNEFDRGMLQLYFNFVYTPYKR